MEVSKIHLSPAEKELFSNAEIILTKNRIITKVIQLLQQLQNRLLEEKTGDEYFSVPPKISKGENYLGLPYVILDYPRKSEDNNLFFIRSMFWWGHFYSSTLHLSGQYLQERKKQLIAAYDNLSVLDYYVNIHPDPWIHHFDETNYKSITNISFEEYKQIVEKQEHVKIATYWSLTEWDSAEIKLYESWMYLMKLIS